MCRELVKLECEDCGADLELKDESYAYCKYCGQTYIVNALLERIPEEPVDQVTKEELYITNGSVNVPPAQILVSNKIKVLDLSGIRFLYPYYGEGAYIGENEESVAQGVLKR